MIKTVKVNGSIQLLRFGGSLTLFSAFPTVTLTPGSLQIDESNDFMWAEFGQHEGVPGYSTIPTGAGNFFSYSVNGYTYLGELKPTEFL